MIPGLGFLVGKAIPWKLIGTGLLMAIIGILLWVHLSNDRAKDNKITELNKIITQLEIDKVKLKISNDSLNENIKRQREERIVIDREYERRRNIDTTNQLELNNLRKQKTSKERKQRIKRLTSTRKKSYILRAANKQAQCQWDNYDEFDGKCISGKWRNDKIK